MTGHETAKWFKTAAALASNGVDIEAAFGEFGQDVGKVDPRGSTVRSRRCWAFCDVNLLQDLTWGDMIAAAGQTTPKPPRMLDCTPQPLGDNLKTGRCRGRIFRDLGITKIVGRKTWQMCFPVRFSWPKH